MKMGLFNNNDAAGGRRNLSSFDIKNLLFYIGVVVVLGVTIYLRVGMYHLTGFFEPDGFYHYSIIRQAVANNFQIPKYSALSGWPAHTPVIEPNGLYEVTLIPYMVLRYFGVNYYTIMRLIPVLFGIFDVLGAYLLSRYLSKDRFFALLVMAFVALSSGDAARTNALVYRGDGFITIFLIMSLVFALQIFREEKQKRKLLFAAMSGIFLSICNYVWNGAPFATAVYYLAMLLIMLLGFVYDNKRLRSNVTYMALALVIWWLLVRSYEALGFIIVQPLTGIYFVAILIITIAAWLGLGYGERRSIFKKLAADGFYTSEAKIIYAVAIAAVFIIALDIFAHPFLCSVFVDNGAIINNKFSATIQELQPPSFSFLFDSFGINLFANPTSIFMALAAVLNLNSPSCNISTVYFFIDFVILLATMLPYFFMQVYDSGKGIISGIPKIRFEAGEAFAAFAAYFIVTAYLQIHAIRFNSLVAVPIAIFSAYTVYWLIINSIRKGRLHMLSDGLLSVFVSFGIGIELYNFAGIGVFLSLVLAAAFIIVSLLLFSQYGPFKDNVAKERKRLWAILLAAFSIAFFAFQFNALQITLGLVYAVILLGVALAISVYSYLFLSSVNSKYLFMVVLIIFVLGYFDIAYSSDVTQADFVNPTFLSALNWIRTNTPANSTFLTLWPDGSVIEGWAQRISVTDSVGSQNASKADPFAAWLLNSSPDPKFLTSNINGRPDYFLIRYAWLNELSGIYTEANISLNESYYGYIQFNNFSPSVSGNSIDYIFGSSSGYKVLVSVTNQSEVGAYVVEHTKAGQTVLSPFSYVAFYNQNDGNYSILKQTLNNTNGDMFMITYSGIPNPTTPPEIKPPFSNMTGALMMGTELAQSNFIRLLYFCNNNVCEWNTNGTVARMQQVYSNSDTKVFRILYNSS
jgi:asparagine N-glycosylation enzyme membrane subunit Stt3